MSNNLYWSYNCPLQAWPEHQDDDMETGPIVETKILNYMPRKQSLNWLTLSDLLDTGETREQFFKKAALHLENLARQFREAANKPETLIYYHDDGMATAPPREEG